MITCSCNIPQSPSIITKHVLIIISLLCLCTHVAIAYLLPFLLPPGLSSGSIAGIAIAGAVIFVLLVVVFAFVIGLLIYGYKNPQSKVGLYMIEVST